MLWGHYTITRIKILIHFILLCACVGYVHTGEYLEVRRQLVGSLGLSSLGNGGKYLHSNSYIPFNNIHQRALSLSSHGVFFLK